MDSITHLLDKTTKCHVYAFTKKYGYCIIKMAENGSRDIMEIEVLKKICSGKAVVSGLVGRMMSKKI